MRLGVALAALLCLGLALLVASKRAQSLLVFVQWLNWPPFDWESPASPSPGWVQLLSPIAIRLFGRNARAFAGLPTAMPFTAEGPHGAVCGWRIPRRGAGECTVLYLHGNAGNIAVSHRVQLYELLSAPPLSCDVVAIDYRGFGHSDACWPEEATAVEDALVALEALPGSRGHVIVWGHSLGTGVAMGALAALCNSSGPSRSNLPRGLVLESPFLSVPDVAAGWVQWLPGSIYRAAEDAVHAVLGAHRFDSSERIEAVAARLDRNVIVLHGGSDDVVPYAHGEELARRGGVALHSFQRGHDDIVDDPGLETVLQPVFRAWFSQAD